MRTLITGGLVARTDGVFNADILIEDERILELGERLHERELAEGTRMVDVSGCVVMPGGVDAHTHLNLTAQGTHVSDGFEAGTLAAAWGGTTTVIEHPGFGPQGCGLLHQPAAYREEAEGRCYVDYAFHGVLQHVDGTVLADVPEAVAQGFPTLKAYTTYEGMLDDAALLHILSALRDAGGLLAVHAENDAIAGFLTERLRQEAPLESPEPSPQPPAPLRSRGRQPGPQTGENGGRPGLHRPSVHSRGAGLRPRGAPQRTEGHCGNLPSVPPP